MFAKKPITWGMKREVRKYYLGSKCELTGIWGAVVLHHGYDSRRFPFNGFTGRPYSIFDGQLRNPREELLMHFYFSAGNNEQSLIVQALNNQRLFEGLRRDWDSGRDLPFPSEVLGAIPGWIERYPEWLREFEKAQEVKRRGRLILFHQRRITRKLFPNASLKKRRIKKIWNQPSSIVLRAIAL